VTVTGVPPLLGPVLGVTFVTLGEAAGPASGVGPASGTGGVFPLFGPQAVAHPTIKGQSHQRLDMSSPHPSLLEGHDTSPDPWLMLAANVNYLKM
jgi:hypothetical protein